MADVDNHLSNNKQFLQQFERQRLNKPCQRIIDLRGKVPGECQAYLFGGKTHYLDDRGYLLVKQLLDRFNGRYTIGVYEAFQKAMQKIKRQDMDNHPDSGTVTKNPLLYSQASRTQLIPFDQRIQRQEARIQYATPVELRLADLFYTATTVDISTSAIRVVLKRAYTLHKNDLVQISFTDFDTDLLTNIEYRILKITHDEKHTFLVLVRDSNQNKAATDWLDDWTRSHTTNTLLDLDNELFNLAVFYYQHLYARTLTDPVLWLSSLDDSEPVVAWHGNIHEIRSCFKCLPVKQILETADSCLVVLKEERDNSIVIPCQQYEQLVQQVFPNDSKTKFFLLHPVKLTIDSHQFSEPLSKIATKNKDYADKLKQKLMSITMMVRLTDITSLVQKLSFPAKTVPQIPSSTFAVHDYSCPDNQSEFQFSLYRKEPRFIIHTPLTLHIDGKTYPSRSLDFSYQGIAFEIPESLSLEPEMQFEITFERWKKQSSRKHFDHIPFILKTIRQGTGHAERFIHRSSAEFNTFLKNTLEQNKQDLRENITDIITCQESHIFASLLVQNISSTPVFFGFDEHKKRILQAVASTPANQAKRYMSLWPILGLSASSLKTQPSPLRFGIYCYQRENSPGDWVVATDLDFESNQQKNIFIARALNTSTYAFFYCATSTIQSQLLDEEYDLNEQLAALRARNPHKVEQIKSVLYKLFAVGEITDITDFICAMYRGYEAIVN